MAIAVVVARVAGIDVAKASLVAWVRVPDGKGGWRCCHRTYGTVSAELVNLREWLCSWGVTRVGMESTSRYWKPVYYVLEQAMECWLLNARHMRNVPGRKTDVCDAEWICDLVAHGLVRPSLVPPPPIRRLRNLTRRRTVVLAERAREKLRLEKLLEDAGIKLSVFASDLLGASARAMLTALIAGERDGRMLAELAQKRMRVKIPMLTQALVGHFDDHHGVLTQTILTNIEGLDAMIADLDHHINVAASPYQAQLELIDTIPGFNQRNAQVVIAETGADMTYFPTPAHLASWAGICPGNNKTGGTAKPARTQAGNRWLKAALGTAAMAAARTTNSYPQAQYRPITARRGAKRARVAVAHSLTIAIWHILATGVPYHDLGGDYFLQRDNPQHRQHHLVHQLQDLGFKLTLTPRNAA